MDVNISETFIHAMILSHPSPHSRERDKVGEKYSPRVNDGDEFKTLFYRKESTLGHKSAHFSCRSPASGLFIHLCYHK